MTSVVIFIFVSCILFSLCRKQLANPSCHGFYRFFAFEGILLLLVINYRFANLNSWNTNQAISFCLLITSLIIVILSVRQLRKKGGKQKRLNTPENFGFENTTQLVTQGIYKYIRHPMYSSLLILNWGIMFQQPTWFTVLIAALVSLMLIITAKVEETENINFFGENYLSYQRHSKMLIPFVL